MAGNGITFDDISTGVSYEQFPKDPAAREAITIVNDKVEKLKDSTVSRQDVINLENKVKQSELDKDNFKEAINKELTDVKAVVDGIDGGNTAKLEELEAVVNDKANKDIVDSLLYQIEGSVKQINGVAPDENGNVAINLDTQNLVDKTEFQQKTDELAGFVASKVDAAVVEQLATKVEGKASVQSVNGLAKQIDETKKEEINVTALGVVMDVANAQTEKLQAAIDYCIANNKALYIPSGIIYIDSTIYIRQPIEIVGQNNSTYKKTSSQILYKVPGSDINLVHIEKEDGSLVASVKFRKIYIGRVRNLTDDGYNATNWKAYGQKCTGIYAHVDESTFEDVTIVGCKNGIEFDRGQISEVVYSDVLFCKNCIKLTRVASAVNIQNNNFCYTETTILSDAKGYTFNYDNNHAETALNHFIFMIGTDSYGSNNSYENITIKGGNFTQYTAGTESFFKVISRGTGYCYIRNVNINNTRCNMSESGNPIYLDLSNSSADVEISVNNSSFWTDSPVCGGNIANGAIIWNSNYFKKNGSKWSDTSYLTPNVKGINNALGFNVPINSPIDLLPYDYTKYPTAKEGRVFYDLTRKALSYFVSATQKINLPFWKHHIVTDNSAPTGTTDQHATIAQNINGNAGSPFGWVYNTTAADWLPFGQISHRTHSASPTGIYTPRFVGEVVLDTTNKVWYKSVGPLITDWKPITN